MVKLSVDNNYYNVGQKVYHSAIALNFTSEMQFSLIDVASPIVCCAA
ncbi:hypothetical protein [Anabaena azotica]